MLGLDRKIRQLKIAAGEGAIAAEDRAQLLRMAWDEEKQRFKLMLVLVIVVLGLTTVAVALLSVAVVVHFWDTPHRTTAAWSVAAVWVVLWAASLLGLWKMLNGASAAFTPVREEIARDWAWAQERFDLGKDEDGESHAPRRRPATRDELLARMAQQRERIAVLQTPRSPEPAAEPPPDETASEMALRMARAHPVASGVAAAAVVVVVGPRRLLRWAAFVAPMLWRLRRASG
ncbi:hypothetical protein BH10PSE18_BH10PSE18_03780 [soil metagenome]